MKVIILCGTLSMSGASTWVVNIANAFIQSGHDTTIISTGISPKIIIDKNIPVIVLGRARSNILVKLFRLLLLNKVFPSTYRALEKKVINKRVAKAVSLIEKNKKVDFLIKNYTDELPECLKNIKQISVIHSMISESWNDKNIRKRQFDCPDKIATVSLASKQDAESVGLQVHSVIKNPVSISHVKKLADECIVNDDYIIFVGKLHLEKGIITLLDAYKESSISHKLYYLGIGKDEEKLKYKIKEYKLENKVKILGFKPNPMPFIKQAKLLILPSISEVMGYVCIESIILKTPFIVSDFDSAKEFYCKNHTISIKPSKTFSNRLADKIINTLNSDFNFEAYERLLELMSYESVTQEYITLIKK